jgi:DNA-binding SARP family transcriptional activator
MEFRILGPLEVVDDGRVVELGGAKARLLLAALLLDANRSVSRERLIDALWEDDPPTTAQKALHVHVSQLRKALGATRVVTTPTGYLLRVAAAEVDASRFEELFAEGRPHDALALWRGEPLADVTRARFAEPEAARLAELHLACREEALAVDLDTGRHAEALAELDALVLAHPLRERLRELQLLALYRSGRQADALTAYADARAVLVGELGLEPGRSLRELHQAILRQDPSLDASRAPDGDGTFVGRIAELAELERRLDDALAGRGAVVVVEGEPGIGKTRLAEELVRRARARGVQVLTGRCWEATAAPAYWPWSQALGRSEWSSIVSASSGEADTDPESARFELFEAVVASLQTVARTRPILLVLDDMHAADAPSLLLLQFVAQAVAELRVLALAASREPIGALARERAVTRLRLRGLSQEEVAAYLGDDTDADLVTTLYERTEGNPLFLAETVRLVETDGPFAIPDTVRDAIARRFERLGVDCTALLEVASVLGREFDLRTLARMTARPDAELLERLEEAAAARILTQARPLRERFRFGHILVRDTLYDSLPAGRRMELHRAAADALSALHAHEPGRLAELAHHALSGGDFERALASARSAGDDAVGVLAYEEAVRLYAAAIEAFDALGRGDLTSRCELLLALGEAQSRAGTTEAAKESFSTAASLAKANGLRHELARAAAGYGGRIVWARVGRDRRLVQLLEEGAAAAAGDPRLRARLLARLAGALRDEHDRGRRDAISREAVAAARESGDAATLAYALVGRAHAITGPDTIEEVLELATELCELAAAALDVERESAGRMLRIMALHVLGDAEAAAAELAVVDRLAHELRQPVQRWEVDGVWAMLALAEGRFAEAETLIEHAAATGRRAVADAAESIEHMQRATLRDFLGGLEASEPDLARLAAEHPARPIFVCALAYVRARIGRLVEARRAVERIARDGAAALPFDQEWLAAMSFLADAAALVDDPVAAESLYEALRPWHALHAVDQGEVVRGSIERSLGVLAGVLRRWDDADAHFTRAAAANTRMGFVPWLARTQEQQEALRETRAAR